MGAYNMTTQPPVLLSLVMILKDEAASIERTLLSCLPAIDRYTIIDTGSTDGTQDIIRRVMVDVPGQLVSGTFVDFSTTRNAALDLEKEAVFSLMLSGDEVLESPEALRAFCEEHKSATDGAYNVAIKNGGSLWDSARLTRTSAGWHYRGAVHEVLMGPADEIATVRVPGVAVRHEITDMTRRTERYERDLKLLQAERDREPLNTRTVFYLAQTYDCLGQSDKAIDLYRLRVQMEGGWHEEVFEALMRIARLLPTWTEKLVVFLEAYNRSPHRCEPLYEIGLHYYRMAMFSVGLVFAQKAATLPYPHQDKLFVTESYYRWQAWDLVACCAVDNPALALDAAMKALANNPTDARLQQNVANVENLIMSRSQS